MVRLWVPLVCQVLVSLTLASYIDKRWDDLAEKHSWAGLPRGWTYHAPAAQNQLLDLRIGLKPGRMDELVGTLYEVSDPEHASYGVYLSKEEVERLVTPHSETSKMVTEWLNHHDITASDVVYRSGGGDWMTLRIPISKVEKMLDAKYGIYHHSESGEYVVRTLAYSLPRELHDHIDVITPTTYFSTQRTMTTTSFVQSQSHDKTTEAESGESTNAENTGDTSNTPPASCNSRITPDCLRKLYKTIGYKPTAVDKNSLGVAGYLGEYANRADLQTFLKQFRPDAVNATYPTISINGGLDDQSNPGVEANLDIQYTVAISYPTKNTYYSTGGSPPFIPDSQTPTNTNEPYLEWLHYILSQKKIPLTITTSYGDDEQTVPVDYQRSVCGLFAQLGVRGSSVLFSSGDFGVGGGDCHTNDGTNRVQFQPAFPASCPYVTTVGGTVGMNETTVPFSGGGFSNTFARPQYQQWAVANYLKGLGNTYQGLYNASGRAYPDVSAQALGFQVVVNGRVTPVGGTSASSPTVAGIIALLNDYLLSKGKRPLGFLNPWIYSMGVKGFNDITNGNNPGCGTDGFPARKGWDPATGLGTPDFLKLQKLLPLGY